MSSTRVKYADLGGDSPFSVDYRFSGFTFFAGFVF